MIQWYPGHMAKASREISERINLVDVVLELVDARAPLSSQNPMLREITEHKSIITLLMKKDLANEMITNNWVDFYSAKNERAIAIDVNEQASIRQLVTYIHSVGEEYQEKLRKKGIKNRPIRALVLGVPNVGKSTLINRLAGRKIAEIGDRPGITKHQQWIKVGKSIELLDTPGILWPKFDDEKVGLRLAAIGTIKDELLPLQDVAAFVLTHLLFDNAENNYVIDRYGLDDIDVHDMWEVFDRIGRTRGVLQQGGKVNFDKVAEIVLREFRDGLLGGISLEQPKINNN